MSNTDYTSQLAPSQPGYKPMNHNHSPLARMKESEIEEIHQGANIAVLLNEEKQYLKSIMLEEQSKDIDAVTTAYAQESKELQNRLKGESLMFANAIRNADIFGDIKKTEKKTNSFWHRLKVVIGWE